MSVAGSMSVTGSALRHGVGTWAGPGVDAALSDCRPDWCYAWQPSTDGLVIPAGVEFVPMIRDLSQLTDDGLAAARASGTALLGFNEPDRPDQADLDVSTALAAWPRLASTGLRLGSPAVAADPAAQGGWLDRFLTGAVRHRLPVDFVACHWYGWQGTVEATVDAMINMLEAVHHRFGLPLWLTEFAAVPSVGDQFVAQDQLPDHGVQADFLRQSVDRIPELGFVERYAWFALTPAPGLAPTALYRTDGGPSGVGAAFQQLLGR